ncbi:DUF624 domain-containing protein [Glycomyces harbinensis]|uniref:DUF624 domain-containing protein n=1 Tax=Glycomyces harbinensis TaxID=58114 RepID=UPI0015A61177|nr:DUF624 domain-containing protein [Glycomyces harbinensis]
MAKTRRRPLGRRGQAFGEGFALFAECLLTGLWFCIAALPVVTIPAALAAGSRHVAAFAAGETSTLATFWTDFRTAWRESWRVGLAMCAVALVLLANLFVLAQEGVPGRSALAAATFLVAGLAATVLLRACAAWEPRERWRSLFRAALERTRDDASGTGILLGGTAVLAVCVWALWLLVVPMSGCLVGAAVAVHRRRLAREE